VKGLALVEAPQTLTMPARAHLHQIKISDHRNYRRHALGHGE
jgi:hypothetical protein